MFHNFSCRAISAERRGIEPDRYIFQVPEKEEDPLGPLRLTDRRGNIRKETDAQFHRSIDSPNQSPNINSHSSEGRRRSVLARLFARRKQDSQESTLVKGSSSTDDSNQARASVRTRARTCFQE